jgi:VanZ family protein
MYAMMWHMKTILGFFDSVPIWARWLAWAAYLLLMLVLLWQPEQTPIIPTGIPSGPPSLQRDLIFGAAHVVMSGGFVMLLLWAWMPKLPAPRVWWAALAAIAAFSIFTEWGQTLAAGRSASLYDWACNMLGGVLAVVVARWLANYTRNVMNGISISSRVSPPWKPR